jgi:porphobilinogen synthase
MMDHQVAAMRGALDGSGHELTPILAYSGKYAGPWYGPFREAVQSSLRGDRKAYQLDTANGREGVREAEIDIAEGADIVMVKPASHFLDVLAATREISPVPVWAYQVSGEYSMIEAAAAHGWIDRDRMVTESLLAIKRAGAEGILTYYATEVARALRA